MGCIWWGPEVVDKVAAVELPSGPAARRILEGVVYLHLDQPTCNLFYPILDDGGKHGRCPADGFDLVAITAVCLGGGHGGGCGGR